MVGLEIGVCEMLSLSMVPEVLEVESNRSIVEVGLLVCTEEVVLLSAALAEVPGDPPTSEPPPQAQRKNNSVIQLVLRIKKITMAAPKMECDESAFRAHFNSKT